MTIKREQIGGKQTNTLVNNNGTSALPCLFFIAIALFLYLRVCACVNAYVHVLLSNSFRLLINAVLLSLSATICTVPNTLYVGTNSIIVYLGVFSHRQHATGNEHYSRKKP